MPSEKFRHELKTEATQWLQEGLVNQAQLEQLVDRYQLEQLEDNAKGRFVGILISLGCLLIGLGVITFIAANWQEMTRPVKVVLLLSLFLIVNIGGFSLWQRSGQRMPQALGQGLLLIGNLSLGAMIALFAQIFHISGELHGLFIWWGLGVLNMAYGLRLSNLGLLAIAVIGYGYWTSQSYLHRLASGADFSLVEVLITHMPILAALLFVPLAYFCRSRLLFVCAAIATGTAISNSSISPLFSSGSLPAIATTTAFLLPAALLYSYSDGLWYGIFRQPDRRIDFRPLARRLGIAALGIAFYWFAVISEWANNGMFGRSNEIVPSFAAWQSLPSIVALLIVLIVQWVDCLRRSTHRSRLNDAVIAALLIIAGVCLTLSFAQPTNFAWTGMIANGLTTVLGIGVIRESLDRADRTGFWYGMVLLTLLILTKVFMIDTDLLFKALMLVICGVAIIAAGIWFEKYVRSLSGATHHGSAN
jgi:uncharacterized membrane protein